jgi:hypothetical protein
MHFLRVYVVGSSIELGLELAGHPTSRRTISVKLAYSGQCMSNVRTTSNDIDFVHVPSHTMFPFQKLRSQLQSASNPNFGIRHCLATCILLFESLPRPKRLPAPSLTFPLAGPCTAGDIDRDAFVNTFQQTQKSSCTFRITDETDDKIAV